METISQQKEQKTMKPTIEITQANFQTEVLESSLPVLVDFFADWCGPCKMLAPVLDQITTENPGRFKIAKVDIEQQPELAQRFGIQALPTLLYFAKGEVRHQNLGVVGKKTILNQLEELALVA
jgi:thioredoxin 1